MDLEPIECWQEKIHGENILLFKRKGIFQARIYAGNRKYVYRSLKTTDYDDAYDAAVKLHHEIHYQKANNLPVHSKKFSAVIDEYIRHRQRQNELELHKSPHAKKGEYTSDAMLRQIKRVSKFWREYCGSMSIEKIDNMVLKDYVPWRRDYYKRMPAGKVPTNAKLNPAAKTLEWETTFALSLIKYAHENGYRGVNALPTYRYKASRATTRPPFTPQQFRELRKALKAWAEDATEHDRRYTRELLRDYVIILANSGIRVGEANGLREGDVHAFTDEAGRKNYRLQVDGKTGKREVILRARAAKWVERVLDRNAQMSAHWQAQEAAHEKWHNRKAARHGDWLFRMYDGNQVITLIDQFKKVLERANLTQSADGEAFTLYSLRHTYAVEMLRYGQVDVFAVARNMGTSVHVIETYYAKHATARELANRLGN
jgi:integrase